MDGLAGPGTENREYQGPQAAAKSTASISQLYSQSFTAAFGDDLETIMSASHLGTTGPMRLQLIAYSIETGLEAMSDAEKHLCLQSHTLR